ncbi:MAG: hypothetical protein ACRDTA_03180 [Pseudonocardiaceae bacterium]
MFVIAQWALGRDGDERANVQPSAYKIPRKGGPKLVPGGGATEQDHHIVRRSAGCGGFS